MEEQLVSFETAVLAKEKGFSESCIYYYNKDCILESFKHCPDYDECNDGGGSVSINEILMNCDYDMLLAPTQSLLQKWLRDVHNIQINIYPRIKVAELAIGHFTHSYTISGFTKTHNDILIRQNDNSSNQTYENVLEEALVEALNTINTK